MKRRKVKGKKQEVINDFVSALDRTLIELRTMLMVKNATYGNSVFEPKRIFSTTNTIEQLNVRIDDKLSRIANAAQNNLHDDEDAEKDLTGYLILKIMAKKKLENQYQELENLA